MGVVSSALAVIIYTAVWDQQERLQGSIKDYNWAPLHDLGGMLLLMPLGFVIYSFLPAGWLFWAGFFIAQWSRKRLAYVLVASGGVMFGRLWPKLFVAMMGV